MHPSWSCLFLPYSSKPLDPFLVYLDNRINTENMNHEHITHIFSLTHPAFINEAGKTFFDGIRNLCPDIFCAFPERV